ncbi:MAG: o-succinylbenzoate synthase [Cyclobacteriaceae bacterium]|nr:o-succinylbenzoate synthase [Cyclobacteriaceae bacterium]
MKISIHKYTLDFRFEAGTSRGIMTAHHVWFLKLWHPENPSVFGLGECAPLPGLSPDLQGDLAAAMTHLVSVIDAAKDMEAISVEAIFSPRFPALRFAIETAMRDLKQGGNRILFDNGFSRSEVTIPINGLVWMGNKKLMQERIGQKIEDGFTCIKIKIGGIDFEDELDLLAHIRRAYSAREITIRLDANGAFTPNNALQSLEKLALFDIHSVEQPIAAGDWPGMSRICEKSPIPIALDEELIGVYQRSEKIRMLNEIRPAYVILKPSLLGGFEQTGEWIGLAAESKIGWWVTSALESNIGLNAIAQFVGNYPSDMPHGLGTGQLYHNNFTSPLQVRSGQLHYELNRPWDLPISHASAG